jgi:hypothetical protein
MRLAARAAHAGNTTHCHTRRHKRWRRTMSAVIPTAEASDHLSRTAMGRPIADNTHQFRCDCDGGARSNLEALFRRPRRTCSWRVTCCGIRWKGAPTFATRRM